MTKTTLKRKTHLESHVNSYEADVEFTPDLIRELDKARQEHLEGKSKSYTWEEVRSSILSVD